MSKGSIIFLLWVGALIYLLAAIYGAEASFNELVKMPETPLPELIKAQYEGIKYFLMLLIFTLVTKK